MPPALPDTTYHRRAIFLIAGVLLLRLIYASFFANLAAGDEAYYWDWGRQLDYGYYSKPPFIAWLYAFVDWIGGGSLLAIRAIAAIIGAASLLIFYRLIDDLFDARTAWIALLLSSTAPANSVLSFFLTIDAPLLLCWTTALYAFHRYVAGKGGAGIGKGGTGMLVLLFLALAIGHLSKQMMMAFPFLAICFLTLRRQTRPLLKRPALWLVLLGSYLALLPPLIWNAQNDWITFQHTGHHFEVKKEAGNFFLKRGEDFLSFVGSQLGVIGPAVGVILFSICLVSLPRLARVSRPHRLLIVFGAIPLAGMLILALRQGLQPNWPAVFYIACIGLTAAWYGGRTDLKWPPRSWRKLFPIAIAINLILVAYFYAGPSLWAALGKEGHRWDPNRRLLSYDRAAAEVQTYRKQLEDPESTFLVVTNHRDHTSLLAFYLPDQPRVYRLSEKPGIHSQYDLWNNPFQDGYQGKDGLIVVPKAKNPPHSLKKHFEKIEKLGEFEVRVGWDRTRYYSIFLGHSLQGWPDFSNTPQTAE